MVKEMKFHACGKEVLLNRLSFAQARDDASARFMVAALNTDLACDEDLLKNAGHLS